MALRPRTGDEAHARVAQAEVSCALRIGHHARHGGDCGAGAGVGCGVRGESAQPVDRATALQDDDGVAVRAWIGVQGCADQPLPNAGLYEQYRRTLALDDLIVLSG